MVKLKKSLSKISVISVTSVYISLLTLWTYHLETKRKDVSECSEWCHKYTCFWIWVLCVIRRIDWSCVNEDTINNLVWHMFFIFYIHIWWSIQFYYWSKVTKVFSQAPVNLQLISISIFGTRFIYLNILYDMWIHKPKI